ncbi:MAG: hypothetical protein QW400_04080 [Candidatus Diapherotrites archaeon]
MFEKVHMIIEDMENIRMPPFAWVIYVYGFLIVRGILEGLLEYHKTIPPIDTLLLHHPLWYVNVLLSIAIILSIFTKEKFGKTAKVIFHFVPILILVPVLDFFVSGGRGYMLGYAYDLESVKRIVLSIGLFIEGSLVSPGQAFLYWLTVFLLSIYCFAKRVSIQKILLLFVIMYFVICLYASIKFIMCSITDVMNLQCDPKLGSILFLSFVALFQSLFIRFKILENRKAY